MNVNVIAMSRWLLVALTVSVISTACGTAESQSGAVGSQPNSESAESKSSQAPAGESGPAPGCEFILRPAYLPWLAPGEPLPPPQEGRGPDPGSDSADLYWFRTAGIEAPYYVGLRVETKMHLSGPGKPVPVEVGSDDSGDFYDLGPPGGSGVVVWDLGGERCNYVALELTTSGELTLEQARAELTKIARSLQPY